MPMDTASVDNEFLGSTSISPNHVQQAFREYLNDDQLNLKHVNAETIAAGQGFTSFILRLNLTWNDAGKKKHGDALPESVILKALSKKAIEKLMGSFKKTSDTDGFQQDLTQLLVKGHKTECEVYKMFDKKVNKPPIPMALAYATWVGDNSRPPMILLEDLGDKATVLGDGFASLSYEQMLKLAEVLGSLQAWCLTNEEKWRDRFESYEERAKLYHSFLPMMRAGINKAKETLPEIFGKVDEDKFAKLYETEALLKRHKPSYMPASLVHGDFWANNTMFNKLPNGSMGGELIAVIDWQLSCVSNPLVDLGRAFSQNYDPSMYERDMGAIVRRYLDTLRKGSGDKMPKELTFDRAFETVQEFTALSCTMMFIMKDTFQSMFVAGDSPEDKEKREKWFKRAKQCFDYATKILRITVDNDKEPN